MERQDGKGGFAVKTVAECATIKARAIVLALGKEHQEGMKRGKGSRT